MGVELLSGLPDVDSAYVLTIVITIVTFFLWYLRSRGAGSSDSAALQTQEKKLGKFTLEEVARHNSQKDCWIMVKGKVYDVSSYVEEHPGGLAILKNAGGDATVGFHGPQHPPRVFDIIDDFLVGDLID